MDAKGNEFMSYKIKEAKEWLDNNKNTLKNPEDDKSRGWTTPSSTHPILLGSHLNHTHICLDYHVAYRLSSQDLGNPDRMAAHSETLRTYMGNLIPYINRKGFVLPQAPGNVESSEKVNPNSGSVWLLFVLHLIKVN